MIPVFVPSYKRSDATFLKRSLLYKFPLYVFVRSEEAAEYSWLKDRPNTHLIKINNVSNIGETRKVMIKYAISKGIDRIFMMDDDISRLDVSLYDEERGCVRASGTIKGCPEDWKTVLEVWESRWPEGVALFGASYRPFSWSIKKEQLGVPGRAQLQQAVGVDVQLIYKAGLNYQSNALVGNEDLFLQMECYQHNLECLRTNEVQYDCPAMGAGYGGCNASESGTIQQKQEKRVRQFMLAAKGSSLVKAWMTHSGVSSVKFNWGEVSKIMEDNK